jgi:hypothetical protein
MTTEKIYVGIDHERVELTGTELDAYLANREAIKAEKATRQAEAQAKAQAKAELLERLGITADEAKLLLA